jgi:hypothetical protein
MGRSSSCFAAFAVAASLAGCATGPAPAPTPPVAPAPPVVAPPPMLRAPPPASDWRDVDLTAGAWSYDGSSARFLAADGAAFALRCDSTARRMLLERESATGEMIIRTTAGDRRFADVRAPLAVGDPFLDEIVFSRGRFVVEAAGRALIIPAWPEPARAVEDCRI